MLATGTDVEVGEEVVVLFWFVRMGVAPFPGSSTTATVVFEST